MADLGKVMMIPKRGYAANVTYELLDFVSYEGSTYVSLKTQQGVTPSDDGVNWQILAQGFAEKLASQITTLDTHAILGGAEGAISNAQSLIDAIADKVMTKLIAKTQIVNSLLATDPDTVLAGPMGKQLKDDLDRLNSEKVAKTDLDHFTAYSFIDSTALDANIKPTVEWFVKNGISKNRHSFVITLELSKGSTYCISGMTPGDDNHSAVMLTSYILPTPLYGRQVNGKWTWT